MDNLEPNINYNKLKDEIPKEIGNLLNLNIWSLTFNGISGSIPT